MAYVSTEKTKAVRQALKREFPEIKFLVNRGTGSYHGSIYVTIVSAPYQFLRDETRTNCEYNRYHKDINNASFNHVDILDRIYSIINEGNFDHSDIMTDYFHVGFYVTFSVGKWDRPFTFTGKMEVA